MYYCRSGVYPLRMFTNARLNVNDVISKNHTNTRVCGKGTNLKWRNFEKLVVNFQLTMRDSVVEVEN